jgi:hypothetical protein
MGVDEGVATALLALKSTVALGAAGTEVEVLAPRCSRRWCS